MNTIRRTMLTATAALALAALLTGCSPAAGDATALIPGAAPAPASAAPTPTAIPGDRDGNGKISEFEKEQLAKNAVRDYTMPDGSVVQIDPTQPLPAEVVAVVMSAMAPSTNAVTDTSSVPGGGQKTGAAITDMKTSLDAQAAAIGKGVISVFAVTSAAHTPGGSDEDGWAAAASNTDSTNIDFSQDKDTVVADAQFWAASHGYEVIVFE